MLTSPGCLTVVYPEEGHEFIRSPWGEQVFSALTSQLATKQPTLSSLTTQILLGRLSPLRHAEGYILTPTEVKKEVAWQG